MDSDLADEPSGRMMAAYNLTENIKELDEAGFWVFVGKENRVITGGIGEVVGGISRIYNAYC